MGIACHQDQVIAVTDPYAAVPRFYEAVLPVLHGIDLIDQHLAPVVQLPDVIAADVLTDQTVEGIIAIGHLTEAR
ncbi:hypothetical protein BamMEX5DRAFT_6632 [Burkholderia ambifaria MEX-5]|uniref:Uncharacterized protein n=1 Tax=Burkholderia ambifaria MEX-5 TaxID=396597 RepID=B1TFR6_9BURK|nr:hypothetical protein BamMEX5DRAFT_6632 [Burkholderia ambifaria MEX-5]